MDRLTPKQRGSVMAAVKGKNTKPEFAVRRMLFSLGYRYRLHRRSLPGAPDIVFPSRKKVIFVHGCFWHRHSCNGFRMPKSRVEFWTAKFERNAKRDAANRRRLRRLGWKSFVIWECQLRNPDAVQRSLTAFLGCVSPEACCAMQAHRGKSSAAGG